MDKVSDKMGQIRPVNYLIGPCLGPIKSCRPCRAVKDNTAKVNDQVDKATNFDGPCRTVNDNIKKVNDQMDKVHDMISKATVFWALIRPLQKF